MRLTQDDTVRRYIREHRVARLATADAEGHPSVVPICYVFDGDCIYSPIDEKPKFVSVDDLKRVRNIRVNPRVSLVIDDYSDDWSKLGYVLISGVAEIIEPSDYSPVQAPREDAGDYARAVEALRDKYPQYQAMSIDTRPIIKITPTRIKHWASSLTEEINQQTDQDSER